MPRSYLSVFVLLLALRLAFFGGPTLYAQGQSLEVLEPSDPFLGQWAMVLPDGKAGWMTVFEEEDKLSGQLWMVGAPKPMLQLERKDAGLHFVRKLRVGAPEYEGGPFTGKRIDCPHVATIDPKNRDRILVEQQLPQPDKSMKQLSFHGKRMPLLPPRPDLATVKFGEPIRLFNGRNLDGWRLGNPKQINGWAAVDGELRNTTPKLTFDPFSHYGNLRTERTFMDFNLTIEFKVPPGGNSGIYLRGVYEAQVVDRDSKMQGLHGVGAIFNRLAPSEKAGKPGDEWQHYDLTLVDRHVTVILNGKKVIDNEPLLGATNGGLMSDETIPGPLYLQGDHTAVSYRNIVLRPVIKPGSASASE